MPTIEIDGTTIEAETGTLVIQAADEAGIYIPRFCYHKKLSVAANCRMCLVEVEKAPKPLPACATPVTDGMKIFTRSALAVDAQRGTMEFLLINHPLDCPVCDQGGECPLQDQAMGYGEDVSRFSDTKRVVEDKDIGPLIETEMTRCIHCTRCVRFGQELAGIMELGATRRGEHMEIGTYIGHTVDSELSGNMIDLCPVGALTNKPYRFTARVWELVSHFTVSPHDCVGSNMNVQSLRGVVKRVLPQENEAINECWLSDRDRYSYRGLNHETRLLHPKIRADGRWLETDWENALEYAAEGLRRVIQQHGAEQLGALASPTSTLEEFYLLQRLVRSLGSHNVDHRLHQRDFRDDDLQSVYPSLGCSIAGLEDMEGVLLIGSNVRKEQPILGLRLRHASLNGAKMMAINMLDYRFHFDLSHKRIVAPHRMPQAVADLANAVYRDTGRTPPGWLAEWDTADDSEAQAMAKVLNEVQRQGIILLGLSALMHPHRATLLMLADEIAQLTGGRVGMLPDGNGVGAWIAGCVPHRGPNGIDAGPGLNAAQMVEQGLKGYLLLGVEPALDHLNGNGATEALRQAEFVVSLSMFDISNTLDADVLLPMAPFTETSGTFVNCEGKAQRFLAAVPPAGAVRPAWKILRVLGNLMNQPGFDYVSADEVCAELSWETNAPPRTSTDRQRYGGGHTPEFDELYLERVVDVPLYRVDALVRRADALQATADNPAPAARVNRMQADRLGLAEGDTVHFHAGDALGQLPLVIDGRVPDRCVYVPAGYPETMFVGTAEWVRVMRT